MFAQKLINNGAPSGRSVVRSRISCNPGLQFKSFDLVIMPPLGFGGLIKTSADYSFIIVKFLSLFIGLRLPACPHACTASPAHDG